MNVDLDCVMKLGDHSSRATVVEGTVPIQHAPGLKEERAREQASRDVDVQAREKAIRREMSPSGIEEESRQRLVRTKEDFVRDLAERMGQYNKEAEGTPLPTAVRKEVTEPVTGTYDDTEQLTACSYRKRISADHDENVKEEEGGRYQTRRTMKATVCGHGDIEQVCEKPRWGSAKRGIMLINESVPARGPAWEIVETR